MDNKRFFTLKTEGKNQFYKIPKVFMCKESKYNKLSAMAKLTYAILADRNSASIKNGWVDDEQRVFFLFNQENLCEVLGIKDPKTLRKYLKELESVDLIYTVRQGAKLPNRLYLLQVEITESQAYKIIGKTKKTYKKTKADKTVKEVKEIKAADEQELGKGDILEIMAQCQNMNFKIKKVDIINFISLYGIAKVKQALISISYSQANILKPTSYLAATLQDLSREKKVDVTINKTDKKKTGFNDYNQRDYDYNQIENQLLGW